MAGLVVAGLVVLLNSPRALAAVHEFAKLTPSDGAVDDLFGRSVGISGNTAIVGAEGNAVKHFAGA